MITYATWNPADKGPHVLLEDGNLLARSDGASFWSAVRATQGKNTGKHYFELAITGSIHHFFGFGTSAMFLGAPSTHGSPGRDTGDRVSYGYMVNFGRRYYKNAYTVPFPVMAQGDILRIKADLDAGEIYVAINGGDWETTPLNAVAIEGEMLYPAAAVYLINSKLTANFGASTFAYSVPDGYNAGWYEDVVGGRIKRIKQIRQLRK